MTEPADYKMTTPEFVTRAVAILVNPIQFNGVVRLVCSDTQPHNALKRLETAFFDAHTMLNVQHDQKAWSEICIDKLLMKTFQDDMLCISMPDQTPVVLIKESSIEKITVQQALEKAHASSVLLAIKDGKDVPKNVVDYMLERENRSADTEAALK